MVTVHRSGSSGGDFLSDSPSRSAAPQPANNPIRVQQESESLHLPAITALKSKARALILSSRNPKATFEFLKSRFHSRLDLGIHSPVDSARLKVLKEDRILPSNGNGKEAIEERAKSPAQGSNSSDCLEDNWSIPVSKVRSPPPGED